MNQNPWDRGGGRYKRAHSMDSWLRGRDEDLALFHDMRTRERSNFLYPSNDDIEASLSTKFGGLSDCRFSISTPTHKPGLDLLTADAEKNDYDWLLTPPGTPLFPSLDQDIPTINMPQRSVSRSTSISKASRLSYLQEPSPKVLRRNPSPHRPSTASSTSSSNSTMRGRPSSPSLSSSSPSLRPSTPSARSSTPRVRASTTVGRSGRSLTPTLSRTTPTPTIRSSSAKAGARSRGSSLSPKLQAWHPLSLPGFSTEPPPNLRTSVSDRPALSFHGGSFNSRHGSASGARNSCFETPETPRTRQQPMSPNTSRSSSSYFSQDRCSSQTSKGSVISSCDDDDLEISKPALLGNKRAGTESTFTGSKWAVQMDDLPGSKYSLPAKRQIRPTVSGEALNYVGAISKKPIESSTRQVENRRASQNMFRPLLSSVPASSFHSTRSSSMQCRPARPALESFITTKNNASSEQGICIVPDNESGDELECKKSEWEKVLSPEIPAKKLVLVGDEAMKEDWHGSGLDRYGKHDYLDLDRHDIESNSGLDDLHPCRNGSVDGCEKIESEIDMSVEQSQHGAFNDILCSYSSAEIHKDRISMLKEVQHLNDGFHPGSADDGLTSLDLYKSNIFHCKEDDMHHLFLDIQEDLPVNPQSNKLQDTQSGNCRINSFHSHQSCEADVPPIFPATKLAPPMMQEANAGKELEMCSPQEQQELRCFEKKNCSLDIDLKRPNNLAEEHSRDQPGHEQFNNQCGSENQSLHSSYRDKKYNSCVAIDKFDLVHKSCSLSKYSSPTVHPQLSYDSRVMDANKSESTVSDCTGSISHSAADRRVDWSAVDPVAFERSSAVKLDINLRLQDGTSGVERGLSIVGDASVAPFECSVEHGFNTKEQARTFSNTPHWWIKEGSEVVTSNLHESMGMDDNQTEMVSEECCQEHFVDVLEVAVSSECRLPAATRNTRTVLNILSTDKLGLSLAKAVSREEKEWSHAEMLAAGSESEAGYEATATSNCPSSFTYGSDQSCSLMRNSVIDDFINLSSSQQDFEVPIQDFQHERDAFGEPVSMNTMNRADFISTSFCSEQDHPAATFSIDKVAGNEQTGLQLSDVAYESVIRKEGSKRLQDGPELAVLNGAQMMDLGKCMNDAMQSSSLSQQLEQDFGPLGNAGGKPQPEPTLQSCNLASGATDTVVFCSSIVHDIVYRAATIAIEKEDRDSAATPGPTTEQVVRRGLPGAGYRSLAGGNEKGKIVGAGSAVRRTLTYVQMNQKMVLQQTPMVTHQQSPMDETGTAVLKSEEALTPTVIKVPQQDYYKARKVKSRCRCSIM